MPKARYQELRSNPGLNVQLYLFRCSHCHSEVFQEINILLKCLYFLTRNVPLIIGKMTTPRLISVLVCLSAKGINISDVHL